MVLDELRYAVGLASGCVQSQFTLGLRDRPEITTGKQGAIQAALVAFTKVLFVRNQVWTVHTLLPLHVVVHTNVPNFNSQLDGSSVKLEHRTRGILPGEADGFR